MPARILPLLALLALVACPALAQPAPDDVARLSEALREAERAHLWRVAAWGGLNVLGGTALWLGTSRDRRPAWYGAGWQSAAWGAINVGIATVGLLHDGGALPGTWAEAFRAENTYADILLFNLGLNVAYSAVGTTLVVLSYRGATPARTLRGHGSALILQGAGLFVLDALAYLGTRTRLDALVDLPGTLSVHALPGGLHLAWLL